MSTPKPYLSWTQLAMVETNPAGYERAYLEGERMGVNRGMAKGKEIADALEDGEATGDLITDLVVAKIPKLAVMEAELKCTIEVGKTEIPLLGYADTCTEDMSAIKEYKTGVGAWTQDKADKHGQLDFYSVIIEELTGKIPDIELIWVKTEKDAQGRIQLTGEIQTFKVKKTKLSNLKMKIRMAKAWQKINAMTDARIY